LSIFFLAASSDLELEFLVDLPLLERPEIKVMISDREGDLVEETAC
jgi:hypothetical protein